MLGFKAYQSEYVPFGECGGVKEDITTWGGVGDGFPTTLCCRNALTVLSEAMASQARNSLGQVFVSQDQWNGCGDSFHPQQGMSLSSCGFDNFYLGSSKCSSLVLQDVRVLQKQYTDALDKCSHFDHPFDESCADCSGAILSVRDGLYAQQMGQDSSNNDTERAICGVAAIVAVAADKPDDPFLADKFLRCLPRPASNNKSKKINSEL